MLRSLAFTALLEWPEFGALEITRSARVVTHFVDKIERARAAGDTRGIWEHYSEYRYEVTGGDATCAPGVLDRHVDALLAGDEQ